MFGNFFFENRAVYEISWKVLYVQPGRPQMTIYHLCIACWMPMATHTHTHTHKHSECVITIAFPLHQWLNERASVICSTFIACRLPSPLKPLPSQFSSFPQLRLTVTEHTQHHVVSFCVVCNNTKMKILHWNTALCRCWRVLTPSLVAGLKLQSNVRFAIIPFQSSMNRGGLDKTDEPYCGPDCRPYAKCTLCCCMSVVNIMGVPRREGQILTPYNILYT